MTLSTAELHRPDRILLTGQMGDGRSHIKVRDRGDMVYLRLQGA